MRTRSLCPSKGFSLVELLAGAALTTIMLGGVVVMISNSRSTYSALERISQIRESGRLALDMLANDIRSADFPGCSATSEAFSALSASDDLRLDFLGGPILGYERTLNASTSRTEVDQVVPPNAAADSSILLVRAPRKHSRVLAILNDMRSGSEPLAVQLLDSQLRQGDIAMIYDCHARTYFKVDSLADGKIHHRSDLQYAFPAGAEVLPVQATLYYVGSNADSSRALWRQVGSAPPEEIIPGIVRMNLRFSTPQTDDSGAYQPAGEVADWSSVTGVSIELIAESVRARDSSDSTGTTERSPLPHETLSTVVAIRNAIFEP